MEGTPVEVKPEEKKTWISATDAKTASNVAYYALIGFSAIPAFTGNFAAGCYVMLFALFIRYAILEFNLRGRN